MDHLPEGEVLVDEQRLRDPIVKAVVSRLQQLGVTVRSPIDGYDFELSLRHDLKYPLLVLVEIGYLLAQITDHRFPEDFEGFGAGSAQVPSWIPEQNRGTREPIRVDTHPVSLNFRFDLQNSRTSSLSVRRAPATLRYSTAPVETKSQNFAPARFLGWAFSILSLFQIFMWSVLLLWAPLLALPSLAVQSLALLRVGRWLRHPAREGKRERTMWLLCALSQGGWLAWLANPQIEYHGFPTLLVSVLMPLGIGISALFLALRRPHRL